MYPALFSKLNPVQAPIIARQQIIQNLKSWCISSQEGLSFDKNFKAIPWFTYPAIAFLNEFLNKKAAKIFEFGCGNSTIYFSKTAQKTISLETKKFWFEKTCKSLIKEDPSQIYKKTQDHFLCQKNEIFLMENGLIDDHYQSFPRIFNQKFDLIIIDSIKRFEAIKASVDLLSAKGIIVLDDSQRKSYQKIFDFMSELKFQINSFPGIAPGQIKLKNTTIFYRRSTN